MNTQLLVSANLFGAMSLIFLTYFVSVNIVFDKKWIKLFIISIVVNVILLVLDIFEYLSEYDLLFGINNSNLLIFLCFMFNPVLPLIMLIFLHEVKTIKVSAVILFLLNFLICIAMFILYRVTALEIYLSIARIIQAVISLLFFTVLIVSLVLQFSIAKKKQNVFFVIIIIAIFIAYALEAFFNLRFIVWNLCAICMVLYYLFLHTQFLKKDILTGLDNRFVFEKDIERKNGKENVVVMVVDINNLKIINDTFGHPAGDVLIKEVSSKMVSSFKVGKLYRIGGDEFVYVGVNVCKDTFKNYLEEFLGSFTDRNQISYGYSYSCKDKSMLETFNEADNNMYIEKFSIKDKINKMKGINNDL